jgi:4-hydroxy-tetrahydrodipicolinate synthase
VVPVVQTPFLEDDTVDLLSLAREVEHIADAGCHWLMFPGFVSEWWKLNSAEIEACARTIIDAARGRISVLLNVTAQSTKLACAEALQFAEMGADGLMCLPPFVVPRGPGAVMEHLAAVADATRLSFVLQLSPTLTGTSLASRQVSELPRIAGVKVDFVPPGPVISELRALLPETFPILIGFAGLQMPDAIARGATGVMGGAGHVGEDRAVWEALVRDPRGAGADAFSSLLPLLNSEMQTVDQSIATHKWLLAKRGVIRSDRVRAPGSQLDAFQIAELEANLARAQRLLGS